MEGRGFPRVPVHLSVSYRDGAELRSSYVDSLSHGGVFIQTARPLPIGTEIIMEIKLEDAHEPPIQVRGKVVWERLVGRQDGMGVQFTEEPPDRLRKLLTAKGA